MNVNKIFALLILGLSLSGCGKGAGKGGQSQTETLLPTPDLNLQPISLDPSSFQMDAQYIRGARVRSELVVQNEELNVSESRRSTIINSNDLEQFDQVAMLIANNQLNDLKTKNRRYNNRRKQAQAVLKMRQVIDGIKIELEQNPNAKSDHHAYKLLLEKILKEKNSEQELVYNASKNNIFDLTESSQLQCFSGTNFYNLTRRLVFNEDDYHNHHDVIIFQPGHILPGYMKWVRNHWELFGVEMTQAGMGEVRFGAVDALNLPLRVILAQDFSFLQAYREQIQNPSQVIELISERAANAYGIPRERLERIISFMPERERVELSNAPAFGRPRSTANEDLPREESEVMLVRSPPLRSRSVVLESVSQQLGYRMGIYINNGIETSIPESWFQAEMYASRPITISGVQIYYIRRVGHLNSRFYGEESYGGGDYLLLKAENGIFALIEAHPHMRSRRLIHTNVVNGHVTMFFSIPALGLKNALEQIFSSANNSLFESLMYQEVTRFYYPGP